VQARIYDAAMRVFAIKGAGQVNIRELAEEAGIARGTIYNNISDPEHLFEEVVRSMARDMFAMTEALMRDIDDPALRLGLGVRMFVRRAQEEPHWARFLIRFAMTEGSFKQILHEVPALDIVRGIEIGRYDVARSQVPSLVSLVAGSALSAMVTVLDGHRGWKEAGSDTVEVLLRGLGLPKVEARVIAEAPLPKLGQEV